MTVELFKSLAADSLNILFAGSLWFGIFWLILFSWLMPKRLWGYAWAMFVFLTFLAYGHEALRKHYKEHKPLTTAEKYEHICNEGK